MKGKKVQRGNFLQLVNNRKRLTKFLGCIFIGLPIWFVIGILVTFAPEFAKALGVQDTIKAGDAIMYAYLGLALGDILTGFISNAFQSRKKVVLLFISITMVFMILYLFMPVLTQQFFYITCFIMGIGIGYWAMFVTIAAEQFGTNLRSTVATTVPNFIRFTVVPLIFMFKFMRDQIGVIYGALAVGLLTIAIALVALQFIDETFGRDLNFTEED
jgi:MFS family permease